MRGIFRRASRLQLIAGLAVAVAMPALSGFAARAQGVSTTTTLSETSTTANEVNPAAACTLTTLAVSVAGNTGTPAGSVVIDDAIAGSTVQLGSAALNSAGQASFTFDLAEGTHSLSAVYAGNSTFDGSKSAAASVDITAQCASSFVVGISVPGSSSAPTMTLTPGDAGTATITIAPSQDFVSLLTANGPAFITISCSGLSDLATCAFTPENVEILPGQNGAVTSSMVIQSFAASTTKLAPGSLPRKHSGMIAWAFLPGILGLGGLAWGARRKAWLKRVSLIALVSVVTALGATGCNPLYGYKNRGPLPNPPTPAGTYTVKVSAQYSNGVTAIIDYSDFTLVVK
ncbi:MAG: Ig-like domain-containing protein [Terracidiphilus sp.]